MLTAKDIKAIPFLASFQKATPISDGYSRDGKFLVVKDGLSYLLRTFEASRIQEKEREFHTLRKMQELNVRCSKPLEMGTLPDGKVAYMLLTFLEGEDGGRALPSLPKSAQYGIGVEAGAELRKIHSYMAPESILPWQERSLAKHERYMKAYLSGADRFGNDSKVIGFVSDHLSLMASRPNIFQHDDFHVRNLIVSDGRLVGVIDFGRHDWGDPFHEFLKIGHFSSEVSIPFSVGQIQGYFGEKEPDEAFWILYSLYLAMSCFSFIVWTKRVCPQEMPNTLRGLRRVLHDHDDFDRIVPRWYESYSS